MGRMRQAIAIAAAVDTDDLIGHGHGYDRIGVTRHHHAVRVVAGSAKGRRLVAPDGGDTRPTGDRVREALFNALFSLDDAVDGAQVLDLFAGTGALGIEALSRGAAHVTFVEKARGALSIIETNVQATGVADRSTIVRADVLSWLQVVPRTVDLVLADPPYAFEAWPLLLAHLDSPLLVIESNRVVDLGDRWDVVRTKQYGSTVVCITRRRERTQ
jgi:16S rRNA (guanine966-N2)-methyltransferase